MSFSSTQFLIQTNVKPGVLKFHTEPCTGASVWGSVRRVPLPERSLSETWNVPMTWMTYKSVAAQVCWSWEKSKAVSESKSQRRNIRNTWIKQYLYYVVLHQTVATTHDTKTHSRMEHPCTIQRRSFSSGTKQHTHQFQHNDTPLAQSNLREDMELKFSAQNPESSESWIEHKSTLYHLV